MKKQYRQKKKTNIHINLIEFSVLFSARRDSDKDLSCKSTCLHVLQAGCVRF